MAKCPIVEKNTIVIDKLKNSLKNVFIYHLTSYHGFFLYVSQLPQQYSSDWQFVV